jgi:hypothetical protein
MFELFEIEMNLHTDVLSLFKEISHQSNLIFIYVDTNFFFNWTNDSIGLVAAQLLLWFVYPLMKRITYVVCYQINCFLFPDG